MCWVSIEGLLLIYTLQHCIKNEFIAKKTRLKNGKQPLIAEVSNVTGVH